MIVGMVGVGWMVVGDTIVRVGRVRFPRGD